MPNITNNQQKGNWAEQFIAAKLSAQGCLIRNVPQGHDSGIDLYCEMVKNDVPYLHFWCQVKCSSKWNDLTDKVSYSPDPKHVDYWLKQPIPVFLILVPDLREYENVPYYIYNSLNIINHKPCIKIRDIVDLQYFLNNQLPYESFLWDLHNGKVSAIKTVNDEYIKHIPKFTTKPYEEKLKESILLTLQRLGDDYLSDEEKQTEMIYMNSINENDNRIKRAAIYLKPLELIIESTDDKHYQYYETIGKYYEMVKDYERACKFYNKSLNLLNTDPKKVWEPEIKRLKFLISRINEKVENIIDK